VGECGWKSINPTSTHTASFPFCLTMMLDACKEAQKEGTLAVQDILEIVAERIQPKISAGA